MNTRTTTLENASKLINQDRAVDYGDARSNFSTIASFWSTYLGKEISAVDVAMMMTLLKVARAKVSPRKQDSYDDMAGYAALGAELAIGAENNEKANTI